MAKGRESSRRMSRSPLSSLAATAREVTVNVDMARQAGVSTHRARRLPIGKIVPRIHLLVICSAYH